MQVSELIARLQQLAAAAGADLPVYVGHRAWLPCQLVWECADGGGTFVALIGASKLGVAATVAKMEGKREEGGEGT